MNIIEKYRVENGLTFDAMAKMAGLSKPTVWRHCQGSPIDDTSAKSYARNLGIPFADIRPDLSAMLTSPAPDQEAQG